MNSTVRIGIVGAGANTYNMHIPRLQAIESVEIVSICNRTRESSQRVADKFNIPTIYDNGWSLIDADDTNAIVIGTWPYMHHRLTIQALQAGKHVMCEARMARNLTEAREMLAVSRANSQLVAQIVPSPMTLGIDQTIKRLLAEGYVGDVLVIEVREGNAFSDPDASLHWRQDFDLSGLNIQGIGIWYEAIMRWVGEATTVMAMGKVFTAMRRDSHGTLKSTRIPEHIDIVADMACGAQLRLTNSSVTGLAGPNMISVYGSKGTLRYTEGVLYGAQRGDDSLMPIDIPPEEAGSWRVEEEFINAIHGQETITHTDFETGVKYMAFTEAVNRSMVERRAVPVETGFGLM